ncbi:MAG TPA: hypothetical protein VK869_14580 [Rubrobacteraceae bacterium]|nr:hypothetical protein [Rubrobacteraceae bacterium]
MREALFWISGAAVAFLLTAGAFLMLANSGTGPAEKSLEPGPQRTEQGPNLEMSLDEDRLATLEALPNQSLDVGVENTGDEAVSDVNLTVEVYSENTALSDARYYRRTVEELGAGRSVTVNFALDLAPLVETTTPDTPELPRRIVEIRARTPEGVSAAKTLILPL